MTGDGMTPVCRQVWERAVEGGDVMADAALAAHVGSCVTCFRTLAELRDVPRLAAALRADAPAVAVSDHFWDDLAARTTGAAAAALDDRKRTRRRLRVSGFATVVAAAAAFVMVLGRGHVTPPGIGSGSGPSARPTATAVGSLEDEASTEAVDVADLDESALRRLLDRLRARTPANVAALAAGGDAQDAIDPVPDEDGITDQLADLDGPALLRVERSLAGASL